MLKIEHDGDLALASFAKPPVNALDGEFLQEITQGFESLASSAAKAVVLTGEGR